MKVLILFSLVYTIQATAIEDCAPVPIYNDCISGAADPANCCESVPQSYRIQIPDASNCSSYYQCSNNNPVILSCPTGLQWSRQSGRCEWPAQANCTSGEPGVEGSGDDDVEGSGAAEERAVPAVQILREDSGEDNSQEEIVDNSNQSA